MRFLAVPILVVQLLVSHPDVCPAAEYWVSTEGDDSWPGNSQKPFRSIQHGVQVVQPGDTLFVRAGRYEENISVPTEKSGKAGQWVTISAAPGDERRVVVGTETPRVDAYGSLSSAFSLREVQYVRLRGFYCVAPYRGRGSAIGASKSQHIEIINCVATGGGQGGVDANHCDHVTIDGVEAFFNGGGTGWSSGISLLDPKMKDNVVRNCICYGNYDNSSYRSDGMLALLSYSGPMGNVEIDPKTIQCDHNLFFNPQSAACVALSGNRRTLLDLAALRETMPHWAGNTLNVDPGFVDMENLDFRLRSDSPALNAGTALAEVRSDLLGRERPAKGPCSMGCYEGSHDGSLGPDPTPEIEIAEGQDATAIEPLLDNEYEFEWHGILWGFGKLLPEELPLQIDIQGPRKADFLNLSGRFVLGDLLKQLVEEHRVRLILRQSDACRGLPAGPHTIGPWLSVRKGADADERAFVRRRLRCNLWTDDGSGKSPLAELLPALSAVTGMGIESDVPVPSGWSCEMITRNMKLSAALNDLARRLNTRFILSRHDPLAKADAGQMVELDKPFGQDDGMVELTVEKPDGRGRIDLFARVQSDACLCARLFDDNSRFLSPAGIDDTGAGEMYHKAATRLDPGSAVRLAVIGRACALSVGDEWIILNYLPLGLDKGPFQVRVVDEWITIGHIRYIAM